MLQAEVPLIVPGLGSVRNISTDEVEKLAADIVRRNVFARHSWENNFYLERVQELSKRTVIEVLLPGVPNDVREEAAKKADQIEQLVIVSSALVLTREKLQRRLGLVNQPRGVTEFRSICS